MNERRIRSLAKGFSWRALGTLDTLLLALIYTGSIRAALSIGALELLTKTLWYYCHERAWLSVARLHPDSFARRLFGRNAHALSIAKAVSWRCVGALDTFLLSLLVTGHAGVSASIGGTELVTKIGLYYLHERIWHHIPWGKETEEQSGAQAGSPLADAFAVIRYYYHLGVAAFYTLLAVAFVFACAAVVYGLHALLT